MGKFDSLGGHIAFMMFVGAAMSDGTLQQRKQLREKLPPLLDALRDDGSKVRYRAVLVTVCEVMGKDWMPTGEWMTVIDNMLNPGDSSSDVSP